MEREGRGLRTVLVMLAVVFSLAYSLRSPIVALAQGGPDGMDGRIIADPARNPCQDCVPVGSTFTYQGTLRRNGTPVNATCDFLFSLYDSATASVGQKVPQKTNAPIPVVNGLFTVDLIPPAAAFKGQGRWLGIQVRCPGEAQYTQLNPRQRLWATPFAQSLPGFWTQENQFSPNIIGGSHANNMGPAAIGATISGGGTENDPNEVLAEYGTVGGGRGNGVLSNHATIGGGVRNTADGEGATISGGGQNLASGEATSITGGAGNIAIGLGSSILGGHVNTTNGDYSAVLGGEFNTASGAYSLAAGRNASANHNGAFVWGDSTNADINSTGVNQFIVRSTGGIWFGHNNNTPSFPLGRFINTSTNAYLSIGGVWTNASDRALKTDFTPVASVDVLRRLASLPISSWSYRAEDRTVRHMGPMAQDFYAAFGLGADDTHISTVDADGVALAAIQGLYHEVQARDATISQLHSENQALKADLARLEAV